MKFGIILLTAAIGFCFYLMIWDGKQKALARDDCSKHGYQSIGGRDYVLCVDPETRIVYYLK